MTRKLYPFWCLLLVLGLVLTAYPRVAAAQTEAPVSQDRFTDGDELIGTLVSNVAGESIGEIADAVIDLSTGNVAFVTVEFGGFLGFSEQVIPVPLSAAAWEPTTNTFIVDIDEEALEGIEAYPEGWPDQDDPDWFNGAQGLFQQLGLDATGVDDIDAANLAVLSDLMGRDIRNPSGDDVGEINDVLIDLVSGQVVYAIVGFGGFLGLGEDEFAVPINAFGMMAAAEEGAEADLTLDITEEQLESAPRYGDADLSDPDWDAGVRDFWRGLGFEVAEPAAGVEGEPAAAAGEEGEGADVIAYVFMPDGVGVNLRNVIGAQVTGFEGEMLGAIEDALINLQTGELAYLLLSAQGGTGAEGAGESGVTDTSEVTGTTEMTATAEVTGTPEISVTPEVTATTEATEPVTGTEEMTGTEELTPTEAMTGTEGMTESQLVSGNLIPIPAGALAYGEEGAFTINTTADVVMNAPRLDVGGPPFGWDPFALEEDIYGYWSGVTDVPFDMPATAPGPRPAGPAGTFQGLLQQLIPASQILGQSLISRENEVQVGTIDDLIFNNGQLRYAVLSLSGAGAGSEPEATATETITATEGVAGTESITASEDVTATETVTATEPITGSEGMTATETITGTQTTSPGATGATEAMTSTTGSQVIVPLFALIYNHETGQFLMDTDTAMLADAPTFSMEALDLTAPDWDEPIIGYWEDSGFVAEPGIRTLASSLILAEELLGYSVVDRNGEDLGEINDFVIDADSGHVRYAAITFGGFLGLGEQVFFIPLDQLTLSTYNGWLMADLDEDRLESAPSFAEDEWPDLNTSDWDLDIRGFWDEDDMGETDPEESAEVTGSEEMTPTVEAGEAVTATEEMTATQEVTSTEPLTGAETTTATEMDITGPAVRARDLLDWPLWGGDDEEIGEIEDLIIDLFDARVLYAVINTGGFLDFEDDTFIVPFQRVTTVEGEEALRLDVPLEELENAPVFDESLWGEGAVLPSFRREIDDHWGMGDEGVSTPEETDEEAEQ